MNVEHQEQFLVTLVPERAALLRRWAQFHGMAPGQLVLELLAIGTGSLAHSDLGETTEHAFTWFEPPVLDALLARLDAKLNEDGQG